jgi:hypothetical protein
MALFLVIASLSDAFPRQAEIRNATSGLVQT